MSGAALLSVVITGVALASIVGLLAHRIARREQPDSIGLLGVEGVATSTFTREGHVMVRGELWKATSRRGIIESGATVQVVGYASGLVLVVTPSVDRLVDRSSPGTNAPT